MKSKNYAHLIHSGLSIPLDVLPFHANISCIKRTAWPSFPYHLAIHQINCGTETIADYCKPHHHNAPEINIIIGKANKLVYRFVLGNETYTVKAPSAIWIPSGLQHSANVIKGDGIFLCVLLSDKYEANS